MAIERRPDYLIDDDALAEWRWPNFTPAEMACKGSGRLLIVPEFMDRLQRLRDVYGRRMPVTSGYRSPEYNSAVSRTGRDGPHTHGRAVDVAVSGGDALALVELALAYGMTGIGIAQHGPHAGRFIHLDDLGPPAAPRPMIWSYA